SDACGVERLDGGLRARGEHFVRRHEGAVDVRQDKRDFRCDAGGFYHTRPPARAMPACAFEQFPPRMKRSIAFARPSSRLVSVTKSTSIPISSQRLASAPQSSWSRKW